MKGKMVAVLICMLMIGSVFVSASGNNFGVSTKKMGILTAGQDVISVTIPVGSYEIKQVDGYDEISIENFGRLLIPGKPNLPSKIFAVAIPPGTEITKITFDAGEGVAHPGTYNVPPASLPRVIGQEDPDIYEQELRIYEENHNSVYSSDEPYPASTVELVRTAGFRKYNLVDVQVTPFKYHPLSGKLTYYPNINVHVSYTISKGFSPEDIMIDNLPRTERRAEQIILNYNQAKTWYQSGSSGRDTYDYVIITLDSLTSSVTSLVNWEETKGRSVYVATTDWIDDNYDGYDLAEKMRNFLRDKYPSEEWGILDVCLIGHYDDVPMRRTAQNTGYGQPETDYYYAELSLPDSESWDANENHQYGEDSDPIDFNAEVNVGRIPWSDPDTVEHICEKSKTYEENIDPSFKKNILLIGTFFWPDTDNAALMEVKSDSETHPWMEDWNMTKMYEEAQSSYECDYDVSYNNVKTVWSEGTYAFVDWAGHGSPTACYEYYPSQAFVDTDTCNYLNDSYPAIIFADACSNSDTDNLNIGQAMLKQGGVGFLGATKVAYGMNAWDDPMDGSSQSLDYFFTTCCTSGNYTQGQAHQWALLEMYNNGLWYYTKYEAFEWGALWGNPDLTMGEVVVSEPPETPEAPEGPDEWIRDVECTFSAVTTDPEEEGIYYLFDWGDGNFSDWVGPYPSGQTIDASHAWSELGDHGVKVKAKDIWGVTSDWSEEGVIFIVEDQAPHKPEITGKQWVIGGFEYDYTFVATDPEEHDIYYKVDWDDGHETGWLGPYSSGESITLGHTWYEKGEYWLKCWAKDIFEKSSSQGYLVVKVPIVIKPYPSNNMMFNNLLQRMQHTTTSS